MANLKTTDFPIAALPLDGSEIVGLVQSFSNVQSTVGDITDLVTEQRNVHIGFDSYSGESGNVAIGSYSVAFLPQSIAIGYYAFSLGIGSIAFGGYGSATGQNAVAIGYYSSAPGTASIAVGRNSTAITDGAIAIGASSYSRSTNDLAIGHYANSEGSKSIAFGFGAYNPIIAQSSIAIGYNSSTGSDYCIALGVGSAHQSHSVAIGHSANAIVVGEFTRTAHPTTNSLRPTERIQSFYARTTTGSPTATLTADGNTGDATNLPALPAGTFARLSITVMARSGATFYYANDFEMATFVLPPIMLVRDWSSIYALADTPTFALESSTDGASGWDAPTLTIDGGTNTLLINVDNDSFLVDWMAFVTIEASK